MSMHHTFVTPGVVDGAVAHKQAWERLTDKRGSTESIVHDHAHSRNGQRIGCNLKCTVYHKGHSHSIAEQCPTPANEKVEVKV